MKLGTSSLLPGLKCAVCDVINIAPLKLACNHRICMCCMFDNLIKFCPICSQSLLTPAFDAKFRSTIKEYIEKNKKFLETDLDHMKVRQLHLFDRLTNAMQHIIRIIFEKKDLVLDRGQIAQMRNPDIREKTSKKWKPPSFKVFTREQSTDSGYLLIAYHQLQRLTSRKLGPGYVTTKYYNWFNWTKPKDLLYTSSKNKKLFSSTKVQDTMAALMMQYWDMPEVYAERILSVINEYRINQ